MFTLVNEVYTRCHHLIALGDERSAFNRAIAKRWNIPVSEIEDRDRGHSAFIAHTGSCGSGIWISRKLVRGPAHLLASAVAHEAFHATMFHLGRLGVETSAADDEAAAHYLQWLVREILSRK